MKYPIGIQTFDKIIQDGYVYVDKTELIYRLIKSGTIYFLSRPRRFGKSLLMSTLENYFLGRKELFRGLAIDSLETEWAEYPVFHIDFNGTNFMNDGALENIINGSIESWEKTYGKNPDYNDIGRRFAYVLKQAHEKTGRRAVVLVDEYDKPMLDVLDTDNYGERNGQKVLLENIHRDILKGFYSVFKLADADLQFVLLTGVTKFSQVSVFSGFNQPNDISMDARYEALCGITEEELYRYFEEPIRELAAKKKVSVEEMRRMIKKQYDGYHFSEEMLDIYNPFSLLNCFDQMALRDFWFRTGTPTYLIRLLEHVNENVNEMVGRYYAPEDFIDYKADVERPLPMIYQSGYLTVKEYDEYTNSYLLDFPNNEVQSGFLVMVAASYLKPADNKVATWAVNAAKALHSGDTAMFSRLLMSLLSSTTYRMRHKNDKHEQERFFQYTFFLIMKMVSSYTVHIEKETSEGRIDCVVETPLFVYIFEFKRDGSAEEAVRQIEQKGYAKPYLADKRRIYIIGVNFSSETGTVEEFIARPFCLLDNEKTGQKK